MKKAINTVRVVLVLAVFTAIFAQLMYDLLYITTFDPANFFSFFTIQSNVFAATVLLISAYVGWKKPPSRRLEYFRGAVTTYMVVVGFVYFFLLRSEGLGPNITLPWVNFILHYLFPIYILLDWIVAPLAHKLRFSSALLWLIFPVAYLVYSLIRGAITGWYPYAFLDPHGPDGVAGIVIVGIAITLLCLGLTWLLTRKPASKKLKNS